MSFEENLINEKKARLLEAVERASTCIGAIIPYVNFDGCDFPKHECAHIHVEENIICVPDYYLKTATYEELEETAVHEVAHILNQTHDSDFQKKNILLKAASWKPPNHSWQRRKHMDDYELRQFAKYMEADIRKWKDVQIDENGDEFFLKGRIGFKRLLKDEIPFYIKPDHIVQKQSNEEKDNYEPVQINRGEVKDSTQPKNPNIGIYIFFAIIILIIITWAMAIYN